MPFRPASVFTAIRTGVFALLAIVGLSVPVSAREVESVFAFTPSVSNWSLREKNGGTQVGKEKGLVFGAALSSQIPFRNSPSAINWEVEGFFGSPDREQASNGEVLTGSSSFYGAQGLVDWGWRIGVGKEGSRKSVMPFVGSRFLFMSRDIAGTKSDLMSADGRFGCRAEYQFGQLWASRRFTEKEHVRDNRYRSEQDALTASIGFHMPLVTGGDATGGSIAPFVEAGIRFGAFPYDRTFRVDAFLESIRLKGGANGVETTEADRIGLRFGWGF